MRKYIVQGISFHPEMLLAAKLRAKNLDLSLSGFIRLLIKQNISKKSPLLISESANKFIREDMLQQAIELGIDINRHKPGSDVK